MTEPLGFREQAVRLAQEHGCRDIAELGVWEGELSVMFAAFAHTLVLVDPWDWRENRRHGYICTYRDVPGHRSQATHVLTVSGTRPRYVAFYGMCAAHAERHKWEPFTLAGHAYEVRPL